jgi:hypothetical protein
VMRAAAAVAVVVGVVLVIAALYGLVTGKF